MIPLKTISQAARECAEKEVQSFFCRTQRSIMDRTEPPKALGYYPQLLIRATLQEVLKQINERKKPMTEIAVVQRLIKESQ